MLRFNLMRPELAGFVAGKKDRSPGLFGIAFEHTRTLQQNQYGLSFDCSLPGLELTGFRNRRSFRLGGGIENRCWMALFVILHNLIDDQPTCGSGKRAD